MMNSQVHATQFGTAFPAAGSRAHPIADTVARVGMWLRQGLCGMNGHERYLSVQGSRVTLRCVSCQHESPGWDSGARAYQRTYAGDPVRHRLR